MSGRKQVWRKSTTGPDWTDLETMLRAIGAAHTGQTKVIISAQGTGSSGGLDIEICTTFDVLPGSAHPDAVSTISVWPCPYCTAMEHHLYSGLAKHDYEIGKIYQQEEFPDV